MARLNDELGRPSAAWVMRNNGIQQSCEGHLHLDTNSPGDGWTRYQLAEMVGTSGGIRLPMGGKGLTAGEMSIALQAALWAIETVKVTSA